MKCLACKAPEGNVMPFEAYQEAENTHYFASPSSKDTCFVAPYVIVFDGLDILVKSTGDEHLDIGWKFPVYQDKKIKDFGQLIEKAIKERFTGMWQSIRTMSHKPSGEAVYDHNNALVKKPDFDYKDLPEDQISVHATNRGCFSLRKKRFHPIYFLIVPRTRPVNLIPENPDPSNKPAFPLEMREIAADFRDIPLTYSANKIMEMITSGEIVLPIISGDPDWPDV